MASSTVFLTFLFTLTLSKVIIKQSNVLTIRYVPKSELTGRATYTMKTAPVSSSRFRYQCLYHCRNLGPNSCQVSCADEENGKCYFIKRVIMHEDPVKRERKSNDVVCIIEKNNPLLLNIYETYVTYKAYYIYRYHTILDHLTWFSTSSSDRFHIITPTSYYYTYITISLGSKYR